MPIELKNVGFVYNPGEPTQKAALRDINVTLYEGQFVGIIGHTGSGKSTLIQLLNGLLTPSSGQILLDGEDIFLSINDPEILKKELERKSEGRHRKPSKRAIRLEKVRRLKEVRRRVGLVFQYPEHQLFEMTVEKDVAFGPKNLHLGEEEINKRVDESLTMVGLDLSVKEKSPFELSGGQKRRVAIAGVLAMKPDYLILDEPTAGLDPKGRDEILEEVTRLQKEQGIGVILVSHSMEDVARYVDRIIAMDDGVIRYDGTPREVFSHEEELKAMGLGVPEVTELALQLKAKGFDLPSTVLTVEEMAGLLKKALIQPPGKEAGDVT